MRLGLRLRLYPQNLLWFGPAKGEKRDDRDCGRCGRFLQAINLRCPYGFAAWGERLRGVSSMSAFAGISVLLATVGAFVAIGLALVARQQSVDGFVAARGEIGLSGSTATMIATMLGGWVMFSPPSATAVGGVAVIVGYALGVAAPFLLFATLGPRLRAVWPQGYGVADYIYQRHGGLMYRAVLIIMLILLLILLTTGLSALTMIVASVAPVPREVVVLVTLIGVLLYTLPLGLRGSIITDQVQVYVILPLVAVLTVTGLMLLFGETHSAPMAFDASLLSFTHPVGLPLGITLVFAILFAALFNQAYWQRLYAAQSPAVARRSFLLAAAMVFVIVAVIASFGLVAQAMGRANDGAMGAFLVIQGGLPEAMQAAVIVLGVALVMSSLDSLLSAVSSLVATEGPRALAQPADDNARARLARGGILAAALVAGLGAQFAGDILHLLLFADLLCAAAAVPVFAGLYFQAWRGGAAFGVLILGLLAGGAWFPIQNGFSPGVLEMLLPGSAWADASYWKAFLAATLVTGAATAAWLTVWPERD